MRLVFYSTNASLFDSTAITNSRYPSCAQDWLNCAGQFPEHEFFLVSAEPGTFLLPPPEQKAAHVHYVLLTNESAAETAEKIISLNPDIAVAATFWEPPFDWLSVRDSLVAEILSKSGIPTVCHPLYAAQTCFDKKATHDFLSAKNFRVPKALYVHHELFWAERSHRFLHTNVYKESVLHQLYKMKLPVVIKDTVGLSSYGAEVAVSYKEAVHYLKSTRTGGDRIVEEFIDGIQAGCEIYGSQGNYVVLPPFFFSVNRYGITSPKQSIKLGPVTSESFKIKELTGTLTRLARELNLNGVAQADLVFSHGEWFIIEINTRLSGMTETYAASMGISTAQILTGLALKKTDFLLCRTMTCNFKLPIMSEEKLLALSETKGISLVRQIHNRGARQEREKGYCEIVIIAPTIEGIMQVLQDINERSLAFLEPVFMQNIRSLAKSMEP